MARYSLFLVYLLLLQLPIQTNARTILLASSYTTMMGLAAQSARWKNSMQYHLGKVAEKSSEALAWQEAAVEGEGAASELADASKVAQEEGEFLQEEANTYIAKELADEAEAATTEEEADALGEDAAVKEGEATTLLAESAAEETVVEEDTAKATADAALATEETTSAEVDEAATGFCQLIPFVDMLCDVVGGVAAAGLETQSVRAAAHAAEEYAAAAAAQVEVESTSAQASDLQTTATGEEEESAALQANAASLEAQAEAELAEAEADEAAAEEQFAQSALDEEASEAEEMKAMGEEEASGKAWTDSAKYGAFACRDALFVSVVSAIAGLFFVFRIAGSIVLPVLVSGATYTWTWLKKGTQSEPVRRASNFRSLETLLTTSHIFHHVLFFVVFFGCWSEYLLHLRQFTSTKGMGGIVLMFATSLAATQSSLMHAIPLACAHDSSLGVSTVWISFREFWRRFLVFLPLIIMELLFVWVNFGEGLFAPAVIQCAQQRFIWSLLAVTLLGHYFVVHLQCLPSSSLNTTAYDLSARRLLLDAHSRGDEGGTDYGSYHIELNEGQEGKADGQKWETIEQQEQKQQLLRKQSTGRSTHSITTNQSTDADLWFHKEVVNDMRSLKLLLLFEVLMASVMFALIRQATPTLWKLWPASKAIIMSAHPQLHAILVGVCMAAMLVLVCACL